MDHIDESAELYALGLLEPAERSRIDDHVAACDACAARLGNAESAVAALVVASQRVPQRSSRWPLAAAAAFAVTSAGLLAQNVALHGALRDDGASLAALAQSHFAHTQFHTPGGVAVDAKVIYDRGGAWIDVVAAGMAPARLRLIATTGAATDRDLSVRDGATTIFVRRPGPVREVRLIDATGATIAVARPAFSESE